VVHCFHALRNRHAVEGGWARPSTPSRMFSLFRIIEHIRARNCGDLSRLTGRRLK